MKTADWPLTIELKLGRHQLLMCIPGAQGGIDLTLRNEMLERASGPSTVLKHAITIVFKVKEYQST